MPERIIEECRGSVDFRNAALRAFSEALNSDRLELILGRAPQKAKGAVAGPGGVWCGRYGG
jgi:hypothetical protein